MTSTPSKIATVAAIALAACVAVDSATNGGLRAAASTPLLVTAAAPELGNDAASSDDEKAKTSQENSGFLGLKLKGEENSNEVVIVEIVPDSPAAKAGFKVNDVVLKVGKVEVKDPNTAVNAVKALKAGTKVTIRVKRGDKEVDIAATLGTRPENLTDPQERRIERTNLEPFIGLRLQMGDNQENLVIQEVAPDSPAAKAGFKSGDVVVKVGKSQSTRPNDMIQDFRSLRPGDKVTVRIKRDGKDMTLDVTVGKRPA